MSIIAALQTYIKTFASLESGAPVWVNHLGANPVQYSIAPLPGSRIVESYVNGGSLREYVFAFRSAESTADDLERLGTSGFYETFADWLESQTNAKVFPTLGSGKTAELIEALGWGYLFEQGQSETGIYQVQCRLRYTQS